MKTRFLHCLNKRIDVTVGKISVFSSGMAVMGFSGMPFNSLEQHFSQVFIMRGDEAFFDGLPIAFVKIFLRRPVAFL